MRLSRCAAGSCFPCHYAAKRRGTGMFLPLRVCWCPISGCGRQLFFLFFVAGLRCCPASGLGRLRGGDRMAARRAVPVRRRRSLTGIDSRDAAGVSRRASSRFAGDMRACCCAPAVRGSPPRPGSLAGGIFSAWALHAGERFSLPLCREAKGSGLLQQREKGRPASRGTILPRWATILRHSARNQ